jgi:hypothetical protein
MPSLSLRLGSGLLGVTGKPKPFHGWNGLGYYVDGVLSNLDEFGDSYFNFGPNNDSHESTLYLPGEFSTWSGLFYQDGIPFTGEVEYFYYLNDPHGYGSTITTGTKNFINGVDI